MSEISSPSMLERARKLDPLLRKHADANEKKRALVDEVIEAIHKGGFFGMWVPKSVKNGAEMGPIESIEVIETLAAADASTAWVTFAAALSTGVAGAYLEDSAVRQIFNGDRYPVIAGQGIPNGKAVAVKGGYELSGAWSYGSGIKHADYIHNGAMVFEGGAPRLERNGEQEGRIFVVPREKFTYGDNWDVIGLRATGSIDYSMPPTFVAEEFTHINHITEPKRGGALYTLGIIGLATLGHAAFTLGVGRRILDEVALVAQTKAGPTGTLRESEHFFLGFANAEAQCRSARALLFEVWGDIQKTIDRGDRVATRQMTLARLALNHATWTIAEVCAFAYRAGGGIALRQGPIQRYYRDMNAAQQHVTSSMPILRDCGRDLAGLAKGKVWGFIGLMDAE